MTRKGQTNYKHILNFLNGGNKNVTAKTKTTHPHLSIYLACTPLTESWLSENGDLSELDKRRDGDDPDPDPDPGSDEPWPVFLALDPLTLMNGGWVGRGSTL